MGGETRWSLAPLSGAGHFVGAINEWCKAHGLYSTGHYCLEDGMGEHVRQIVSL